MTKHVAVIGAGGLGAVYANIFHQSGIRTHLVASGDRFQRLRQNGVFINDVQYHVPVIDSQATGDQPFADLIIVATKYHQLAEALPDVASLVGPNTVFISLLNGLTSEEIIGEVYGRDKTLLSIAMNLDARREGNRIYHSRPPLLIFGEEDNSDVSPRVLAVQSLLDQAGIEYQTPHDMKRMMWWKFMVNVGMNQSSAVTGATYGRYKTEQGLRWLKESLMHEVIAVAQAENVDLNESDATSFYKTLDLIAEDGKTSMLQDIEAGRKTEIEMFAPVVMRLGSKHGIATPVNQTVFSIIQTLEARF